MTYPPFCYKAFDKKDHALRFIEHGEMRFGSLKYYREIEDSTRRDETEVFSQVIVPGNNFISEDECEKVCADEDITACVCLENGTACFAFCVSGYDVNLDHLREKGEFIVRINAPLQLLKEIEAFCHESNAAWPERDAYLPTLTEIYYTKGMLYNDGIPDIVLLGLSTCQKQESFAEEKEFRYLLDSGVPKDNCTKDHVMVNLNKRLDFCELISSTRS